MSLKNASAFGRRTQALHSAPDLDDALVALAGASARGRHAQAQTVGIVEYGLPANEVERPALMVEGRHEGIVSLAERQPGLKRPSIGAIALNVSAPPPIVTKLYQFGGCTSLTRFRSAGVSPAIVRPEHVEGRWTIEPPTKLIQSQSSLRP